MCISAPAMPLPGGPLQPGPGTYELVDYEGPQKHFMSSSVFLSSTTRYTGEAKQSKFPGPGNIQKSSLDISKQD